MQFQYPQRRETNDNIVVEIDGEVLIYDKNTKKSFCLNKTSTLIWELCDGKNSLSDISRIMGEKLSASVNEELVWLALEQLHQENLIEHQIDVPDSLTALSRRQVIRKISLAAAVVLPLISQVVSPIAANAQSSPGGPVRPSPVIIPLPPTGPSPSVIVG
jgi:Coenzyme PQQ synthesis protein D (PqqD)